MKRSEMVQKLKEKMQDLFANNYTAEEVSKLLKSVEEAGMMPPTYSVTKDLGTVEVDNIDCLYIGWESES